MCRELLAHLAANGTWLTPTLAILNNFAYLPRLREEDDPRLQYMPAAITAGWRIPFPGTETDTPADIKAREEFLARQLAVTGMAAAAGVGILAGTDTPNPFVYPGFSLHDELELLVQAGLSPREALAAATSAPAEFLGATDSLGAVAEGQAGRPGAARGQSTRCDREYAGHRPRRRKWAVLQQGRAGRAARAGQAGAGSRRILTGTCS